MDYHIGLCFFNFLTVVLAIPDSTYFYYVDLDSHSFDEAEKLCMEYNGTLANMPDHKEASKVLKAVGNKNIKNTTLFWIGLKKGKCVQKDRPLKGFHWTADNGENYEHKKWIEEPMGTCTSPLCGLLSVEYNNNEMDWGLMAKLCNKEFPFICKHKGSSQKKACSRPKILGSHDITEPSGDPYTLEIRCSVTDTFTLTCSMKTGEWKQVGGTDKDFKEICKKECKQNCILATNTTNKVQDKSTSSPTKKKTPPTSLPTVDGTAKSAVHIEDNTGDISSIVIPVIIALLIFVVLIVIIVSIVKYCLMRRSKKRAKERATALKESTALNGSDSMEKINE